MSLIRPEDLFPFDEYEARLKALSATGEEFAQSTVSYLGRVKAAYTATTKEASDLLAEVNNISLSNKNAGQVVSEYATKVGQVTNKLETARQAEKNLTDAQKLNAQVVTDLTEKLSSLYQRYQALDPTQKSYEKQQQAILREVKIVTRAIDAQSKSLQVGKAAVDATEGSYQHLSKQTAELKDQLRQMPNAFDLVTGKINQHNKAAVDMLARIQANDKALKAADSSMGSYGRNVGNYGNAISGMGKSLLQNIGGLVGISSAFEAIATTIQMTADMEKLDAGLKAVSRDTDDFNRSQQFLLSTSDELGLRYDSLVKSYKLLKAATKDTSLEGAETEHMFHAVTEAGARLGLTTDDVEGALLALTQMLSKTKVTAEELRNQLGERVPAAMKIMAQATGVSETELDKMMEKGELLAVDVLPKFATQLDKIYGGNAQEKINTMSAGWNRMTNEAQQLVAAFNENRKVSTFFGTIETGIANVLSDLKTLVKSNEWGLFINYLTGGASVGNTVAGGMRAAQAMAAQNEKKFRALPADDRQKQVNASDEKKLAIQKQLDALLDKSPTAEVTKQELALQKELNKEKAHYNYLVKTNNDQITQEARIATAKANEKTQADKARKEKEDKEKTAARKKAESAANRQLSSSLSKSKAGTDVKLADLSGDKQDGIISEKEFIEQRKTVTLAGIAERQVILEKAGKKESDDYKKLQKDKIDAETAYKRDSLKLSLTDSKSATAGSLAGLSSDKAEGLISEQDYVEKKHDITLAGLDDQLRILTDGGQQQSKLADDINAQRLEADRDYLKERLRIQNVAWKTELDQTKTALDEVDTQLGESYRAKLLSITAYYDEKDRKIKLDIANQKISPEEGEIKLHENRIYRLRGEMQLTEQVYQEDRKLSDLIVNDKIAALERYKADATRTPKEIADAEKQIQKIKKAADQEAAKDKKNLDKEVADNAKQKSDEQTEHEIKNAEKSVQQRQQLWQAGLQLADTIGQTIASISSSYAQRDSEQLDKQKENELKLAGDNADAKAAIEEQYAKKKAEMARKAAIQERAAALFSIGINTAQAVMSVLSTGGGAHYLDFGVTAGILSAFVTATGLAQAAAVLAAPLPTFWTGTSSAPEGLALVGDRGPELRKKRDGSMKYYDRPTVDYLDRGDRIYTASQTSRMVEDWQRQESARQALQESTLLASTRSQLQDGRREELRILMAPQAGSQLSKDELYEVFSQALDERPSLVQKFDIDGFSEGIQKGQHYTEHVEKRRRLFQ